ncbi:WXG100 family type VII secretion target [Streptomyces sp. WZ-12]|uniref:WXG100 family type VII secretion target n=1 Tax=Streptomyces sp. WZ-12 TaxID=3030210 RepID=UPI002380E163|nr:WXG100 family type VII secretion target [Streptomyces sp. WZ-12]
MGLNSYVVDKVVPVLELLNIPWPGGAPKSLRDIAHRWGSFGQDLQETAEHLNKRVEAVVGVTWHGDAADAFKKRWKQQYGAFQDTAKNFAAIQKQLDAYADEAEQIVKEIVEIALEIAETELAGALLTVVTAGISDAVAAAASGARAMRILGWVEKFTSLAERAEEAVLELVKGSRTLVRMVKALSKLIQDGLRNSAMNLAGTAGTKWATGQDFTGQDVRNAVVSGSVAAAPGAVGKGLGSLGKHGAPNAFDKMLTGDGLTGKAETAQKIASGAAGSAAGTWAAEHDDPKATVGDDMLTNAITGGGGAYLGRFPKGRVPEEAQSAFSNVHEVGMNGIVYAGGGAVEYTAQQHERPEAGDDVTDQDGAVQLPREELDGHPFG